MRHDKKTNTNVNQKASDENKIATLTEDALNVTMPAPGGVIIHKYKGVEYQVSVLEDGFLYNGCKYKSLSAVAKRITGKLSSGGYEFFKLKYQAKPKYIPMPEPGSVFTREFKGVKHQIAV